MEAAREVQPQEEPRGRCIVAGYDGSAAARAAVTYAARRAGPEGKLFIVYAFGPPPDFIGAPGYQRILDDHEGHGRALLDELLLEADTIVLDTDFELELIAGSPADALLKVAQTRGADEIVVGTRGHGRIGSLLGSVSREVLHHADRPVVVIPEGALEGSA